MDKITHEVRKQQWLAIMEECLASGKPKTTWCRENGISNKQFFYWQRILRKEAYLEKIENKEVVGAGFLPDSSKEVVPFVELQQPSDKILPTDFEPAVIIRTDHLAIELSNTVSDTLLERIGGLLHVNDTTGFSYIYLKVGYTNLRKGIPGLITLIQEGFHLDPYERNALFLFCGRRCDRIKGICFEGDGFCMVYKKIESSGRFQWPRSEDDLREISPQQFKWLMEGLTISPQKQIPKISKRPKYLL